MSGNHEKNANLDSKQMGQGISGERKEPLDYELHCRCKETTGKTFQQLIKLMAGDLAFWRKDRKP